MTRVQVAVGLLLLFLLGWTGLERAVGSLPRQQAELLANGGARLGAAKTELALGQMIDQLRGLARSGAAELGDAGAKKVAQGEVAALERSLAMLSDRAGADVSAAIVGAEGRKLIAAGAALEIEASSRAIRDVKGAPWALFERWKAGAVVVAVAPLLDGAQRVGALVLVKPIDRKSLAAWTVDEKLPAWAAIATSQGDVLASSLEGAPAQIAAGTAEVEAKDGHYAVYARPIEDDAGIAAQAVGFARYELRPLVEQSGRIRLIFWVIAAAALGLTLVTLSLAPQAQAADDEDEDRYPNRSGDLIPHDDIGSGIPSNPASLAADLFDASSFDLGGGARGGHGSGDVPHFDGGRNVPSGRPMPLPPLGALAPPMPVTPLPLAFAPPGAPSRSTFDTALPFETPEPVRPIDPLRTVAGGPRAAAREEANAALAPFIPPGLTMGRGMSPPPPGLGGVRAVTPRPLGLSMDTGEATPPPQLDPVPQMPKTPPPPTMLSSRPPSAGELASYRPFDEEHYRVVYEEFIGSKQRLGEPVDNISYDGFLAKLRKSEQALIDKHGCRTVRFQVVVRDRQVSLRPQLVR